MGRFKKWLKKTYAKLRERTIWAIFTGLLQAVIRSIAEHLGWPAAIVFLLVTGGAAAMDFFANIPAELIWFMAAVALALGIPPSIKASAELRRASADLIRAASGKQKLDQAAKGLRGPLAEQQATKPEELPSLDASLLQEFEDLYAKGEALLERDSSLSPQEWRLNIIGWFDESEALVNEHVQREAFMFRTTSRRPKSDEKFDDCTTLLAARLVKLRRIIGRLHDKGTD